MSNLVIVVEKDVSLNYLVNSFEMNIISLELNTSVTVSVNCFNRDMTFLFNKIIIIEGSEYAAWSNNDDYLRNIVASKMGLVVIF